MERWEERQEVITLPWLWHTLRSQWKWMAAGVVLGVGVALMVVLFSERRYEAQAKLLIESPTGAMLGGSGGVSALLGAGSPELNTQVEVLLSRPLLEQVQRQSGVQEPYREFEKRFRAAAQRGTNVIEAQVSANTPAKAQQLAQIWTREYLRYVDQLYRQTPSILATKLAEELNEQEDKLKAASRRITAFLKQRQLALPESTLERLVERYASLLEQQRTLQADIAVGQTRLEYLKQLLQRQPEFYESVRQFTVPPEVQQIDARLVELNITRRALLEEYQPNAPEVQAIEQQIAEAQRLRKETLARAINNQFVKLSKQETVNPLYWNTLEQLLETQGALQRARTMQEQIALQIQELAPQLRIAPDWMADYNDLQRQYSAALTTWTEKVRAYEQARAQQLIGKVSPILLQPPALPDRQVYPRPVLTTGLGVVFGLMLGVLGALAMGWRNRRLSNRWEAERLLGAPVLAELRGGLTPAQAQLLTWQLRALGGGETWHRALALPLAPQAQPVAQQLAATLQNGDSEPAEPNLPAPAYTNGALRIYTAAPDSLHTPDAERLILVAPKGYALDEPTYQMLSQTGDRLVGVILVEEATR